jgi:hypothetical protein
MSYSEKIGPQGLSDASSRVKNGSLKPLELLTRHFAVQVTSLKLSPGASNDTSETPILNWKTEVISKSTEDAVYRIGTPDLAGKGLYGRTLTFRTKTGQRPRPFPSASSHPCC